MNIKNIYTTSELSEIVNKSNKFIIRFVHKSDNLKENRDYRQTRHGHYLFNVKVKEEILSHKKRLDDNLRRKINNTDFEKIKF